MLILIKDANKQNNKKQNFDGFRKKKKIELLRLKGDLANFFQHYLDMGNLLLNKIHFHRTNNWEGYIETTRNVLLFFFL